MISFFFTLISLDWKKISVGAFIAAGAAAITYLFQYLAGQDFGLFTPLVVALSAIIINAAKVMDITNYQKVLKGTAIAILGALLTYASQYIASADFGIYTAIITAAATILVNIVRKWLAEQRY